MAKTRSLDELMAAHADLYKQFLPTLTQYQDMAKQALEIQIEIFKARIRQEFPKAKQTEAVLVASISARETPAKLGALLAAMEQKGVEVSQVIYDPMTFTFHLLGQPTNGN